MRYFPIIAILVSSTFLPSALLTRTSAEEINVADHGVVPGKDSTYALNRLIESKCGDSAVTLVFPKGQYEFYPENAVEKHRPVSNHDNSLKRIAMPLFRCKQVTIDGQGSTFMFHGRISPVVLDGVSGATLKNFTIDWARPFHDELPVVESNADNSFVVEIDPDKYPHRIHHGMLMSQKRGWEDSMGSNIVFDPKTRSPLHNTRDHYINFSQPHKAEWVGKNRVKITAKVKKAPPVGSVLISYGNHPTSRLCPAIHIANSQDIQIENVTVKAAGGMGVIAERTDNISLKKMTVTSAEGRLVSTRADATHFIGCKGTISMNECLFEHMLDDATNVHGAYVKVVEPLRENELLCEISHFQQWGLIFAGAGDEVALLSRETVLPFFKTKVTGVRTLNEHRFVLTLEQLPEDLPKVPMSVENLTWYPDFTMKNCIVRENRARSILVTTKGKVVIEDNYLSSQMNGILIEGDNKYWYESGAVQDITIRNNQFVNSGFGALDYYPLLASPLLLPEQRIGEGQYHRNIRFVDNHLKSFDGRLVRAKSVEGLEITGNTIEFSTDYPSDSSQPAIDLHYCKDVTISGNQAVGFDRKLPVVQSEDTDGVEINDNSGLGK